MKSLVKMLTLAVVFILLLTSAVLFSGCEKTPSQKPGDSIDTSSVPGSSDTTAAGKDDETTAQNTSTVLFDENTSYTIIRSENASKDIIDIVVELHKSMTALRGSQIKLTTDWVKSPDKIDASTYEILVGYTNHPETAEVMSTLKSTDYAARRVGNKVVIAAWNIENLKAALDAFTKSLEVTEANGKKVITMKEDITYTSDRADLFSASNKLSDYTIIYPDGDDLLKASAEKLAERIKKVEGSELLVKSDKTAQSECEILVGAVNRPAADVLKNCLTLNFKFSVSGKTLVIGGSSSLATKMAVESFIATNLTGQFGPALMIPSDYSQETNGGFKLEGAEDPTLAEGADLRIMSFNILAEIWNDKLPVPGRDDNMAAIVCSYLPDVVGVQEVTTVWYDAINRLLGGVYAFASHTIPNGKMNYSNIIYNTQKAELIECHTVVYSKGNGDFIRNLTWARFRRISDGSEYIVTCTHWDISTNAEWRVIQAKENAQIINELAAKYNVPIFATGDYNRNESTAEFSGFMQTTGMQDPKYTAAAFGNRHKSTHTVGKAPDRSSLECIDHIAVSAGVEVLYYNTLTCQAALDTSDHCPIYIDVKLK